MITQKKVPRLTVKKPSIAVLGGGSWATALVKILTENHREVHWYIRSQEAKTYIEEQQHNPKYLRSATLKTKRLRITNDLNEAVAKAEFLLFVIPSAFVQAELKQLHIPLEGKIIFSAIKGVIPDRLEIMGEFFHRKYAIPYANIGVITGPCHAEEVALEKISYLTVACQDLEKAKMLSRLLTTHYIRVTLSDDIIGTEYAAMLKNIYAIAAGIGHGLGYGDNFQSVLMSNAIREMKRFIKNLHKMKRNINASAYLGDLLVTGYSSFSRNRTLGNMLGKGYTVQAALSEMNMVAEGYYAAATARMIKRSFKTRTPIIDAVYAVLYEEKKVVKVFSKLTKKLN